MRIPDKSENLIGKVCVCSVGRPGIVVGKKNTTFANDPEDPRKNMMFGGDLALMEKGIGVLPVLASLQKQAWNSVKN